MNTPAFAGLSVALVTPMHDDGRIHESDLRSHVERLLSGGVDVLMPCGTTGEGATLSADEQAAVIGIVAETADGRAPVVAGVGSSSTRIACALAEGARRAGADGILASSPPYNRPSQAGLYGHFTAVADCADGLPVILYNVPGRSAVNLETDTILRLAEIEAFVGIKEASGSLEPVHTLLRDRPEGFLVLAGDDIMALPVLALGGDGVVSVTGNEAPALMARMVRAARAGDLEEARRIHFRLLPLFRANFVETNPVPVKNACHLMGWMTPHVRLPLAGLSGESLDRLEAALAAARLPDIEER